MSRYEILLGKPSVIENKSIIEDRKICPDCGYEMPIGKSNECLFCLRYLALTGRSLREENKISKDRNTQILYAYQGL